MITIWIPLPPKECHPNARPHHMAKARATKKYRTTVAVLARAALGRTPAPKWKKVEVYPVFRVSTNRNRDRDNALASLKAAFDGLRDAGVIEDDSGVIPHPVEFVVDKATGVVLTIKEVA